MERSISFYLQVSDQIAKIVCDIILQLILAETYMQPTHSPNCAEQNLSKFTYVTRFGIMSRKSPKVELRYGPRKSE